MKLFGGVEDIIRQEWERTRQEEGDRITKDFHHEITTRILNQRFTWPPLNAGYKAAKIKAGLDPRMLIARGDYVRAIRQRRVDNTTWTVDLPNSRHNSGLSFQAIGMIHELGTARVPARPHWGPVTQIFQSRAPQYNQEIQQKLKSRVENRLRSVIRP